MADNEQTVDQSFTDYEGGRSTDVNPLEEMLGIQPAAGVPPQNPEPDKQEKVETKESNEEDPNEYGKFRKRFDRFQKRINQKDETIEKLQSELEQYKKVKPSETQEENDSEPNQPAQDDDELKRPEQDDYDSFDDYLTAVDDYFDAQEKREKENDVSEKEADEEKELREKEEVDRKVPKPAAPTHNDAWDDILEILDDDERVNDQMVPDLAEMIEKGQLQMSDDMVEWLASNEDHTADVVEKLMVSPRLSRRISRMTRSQMRSELSKLSNSTETVRNPTSISDIRGTAEMNTPDPGDMDALTYERMRQKQEMDQNVYGLPFEYN